MQSIITKYYGPTNTRAGRIMAWTTGNPGTKYPFAWQYELSADANHKHVAENIARKLRWDGQWHGGAYDDKGAQIWVRQWDDNHESFTVL